MGILVVTKDGQPHLTPFQNELLNDSLLPSFQRFELRG